MSRRTLALLTFTALSSAAVPALAQEAPRRDTRVDEIIVTGVPYGVSADATTLAVDILDEDDLIVAPATTLGDLLNGLPGVRSTAFAAGASRPVIRGLQGPRVQVLTNGVGLIDASALSPDHQVAADPGDATRIEVLRGPSTLAYGGTAIGGVVNVIDGRIVETFPEDGIDGQVAVQTSTVDDGRRFSGSLAARLGNFVLTLEGQDRQADDYTIPVPAESRAQVEDEGEVYEDTGETTLDNSFVDLTTYGAGLSWIGARGYLGVSVRVTETDYGVPGHAHEDAGGGGGAPVEEEEVTIGLEQTRWDLRGGLNLAGGPFERLNLQAGYADYEHTEFEGDEVGTVFASDGWEGRLELIQAARGGWRGTVGVQWLDRTLDAVGDEAYVPRTDISELGAFALQRWEQGRWGLEGGLRLDSRELESAAGQRDFSNVSASLGVFFKPAEPWFLGFSVSRNGRAPNEAELFADGPHAATRAYEVGDADLDSETVVSIEGTAHYRAGPLDIDLHVYHARYDNFIDLIDTGLEEDDLPVLQYVQTEAEFTGLELEAGYEVFRSAAGAFRVEAAYDTVDAESDLGQPARIPPWSFTARLEAEWNALAGRLEWRTVGEQDEISAFELPTEGYDVINAFASWRPEGAEGLVLFVEGSNLTDEEVREHASFLKDLAPSPGRNVRFGVAYRF